MTPTSNPQREESAGEGILSLQIRSLLNKNRKKINLEKVSFASSEQLSVDNGDLENTLARPGN